MAMFNTPGLIGEVIIHYCELSDLPPEYKNDRELYIAEKLLEIGAPVSIKDRTVYFSSEFLWYRMAEDWDYESCKTIDAVRCGWGPMLEDDTHAGSSYQADLQYPVDIRTGWRADSGDITHILRPGDYIRVNGEGRGSGTAYRVKSIHLDHGCGYECWSLTCLSHYSNNEFYINELVCIDGKILHLFKNNDTNVDVLHSIPEEFLVSSPENYQFELPLR